MRQTNSITVNLAGGNYPVFKMVDGALVPLERNDPTRRYTLKANVQTGETFYVQFTDEEEAEADKQKEEWDAAAPAREAEAKLLAEEAERFERSLKYEKRIVAFLDILGWTQAIRSVAAANDDAVKALGKALAQLRWISNFYNSLGGLSPDGQKWPGNPVLSQFSDSLVISVDDDTHGRGVLEAALQVLTSNLIEFRFLLRGAVVRGELFHSDGLVFGPALIEAYELESKVASAPRVILSKPLSAEWSGKEMDGAVPWLPSPDGHLFFNFLPPFMGRPFFFKSFQLWQSRLGPIRDLILRMAQDRDCSEGVFEKYIWLADYFDSVCNLNPDFSSYKVLQEAMQLRRKGSAYHG